LPSRQNKKKGQLRNYRRVSGEAREAGTHAEKKEKGVPGA